MIQIRRANERGLSQMDWLHSLHTFSFADYYDPNFMGFADLRVINEDTVQPSKGFGMHSHANMEIISYVISGVLTHKDSMGNGSQIVPGDIQMMSAGTGVEHSEFNGSDSDPVHFLQIWILPEKKNITPSYQQKKIKKVANGFSLIGSQKPNADAVLINQDVNLYLGNLEKDHEITFELANKRVAWLQMIKGKISLNQNELSAGDGAAIQVTELKIQANEFAEFLLFDFLIK